MKFPADGPVMQKRTTNWEPSVEKMTVSEGILKGDVTMFLSLKDGKKHRCQFHVYKYVISFFLKVTISENSLRYHDVGGEQTSLKK